MRSGLEDQRIVCERLELEGVAGGIADKEGLLTLEGLIVPRLRRDQKGDLVLDDALAQLAPVFGGQNKSEVARGHGVTVHTVAGHLIEGVDQVRA